MTENIILPDSFYVGYSIRKSESGKLGFLTPHGTDSASKKRMSTVDGWRDKNIPADVHKNELLSGYKIAQHIHRDYYWGGGNVVWRIVDPRGFEFEIESSNMSKILSCTNIIGGEIQGKCIIGRSNKGINILLPENSEPYINAVKSTQVFHTSTKTSELVPGSIVLLKNNTKMVYLGKYFPLFDEYTDKKNYYSDLKDNYRESRLKCDKAYHLCYSYNTDGELKTTRINVWSDLKVSSVIGIYCTPEQAKKIVFNEPAKNFTGNYKDKKILAIFDKKFIPTVELVEDTANEIDLFKKFIETPNDKKDYDICHTAIIEYKGKYYTQSIYKGLTSQRGFSYISKFDPAQAYAFVNVDQYLSYYNGYSNQKVITTVTAYRGSSRWDGIKRPPILKDEDLYGPEIKWYRMLVKDDANNVLDRIQWMLSPC